MSETLAVRRRGSKKAALFTESVIREMTRLSMQYGGVNLAQGFPDFPAPTEIKEAAVEAIRRDINQYAITWGAKSLRNALAERYRELYGMDVDPERHFTVACGSTEAMIATMLAVVDPGEEVIVFEPFYENYGPDTILSGAVPRYVRLQEPDWTIDEDALRAAVTDRTRAIIVNSPQNPSGKVFSEQELSRIAALCIEHDLIAFTDEIYEFITYDGARHIPIATLPGDGRPHRHHQRPLQVVLGDWLEGGLDGRQRGAERRHSEGPRLPHRRRRRSLARGGGRRPPTPGELLRGTAAGI